MLISQQENKMINKKGNDTILRYPVLISFKKTRRIIENILSLIYFSHKICFDIQLPII